MANNWNVTTDDYDIYNQGNDTVSPLPGTPKEKEDGSFVYDRSFFPMSTISQSTMDQDENNTGPTTDFWTDYPIIIDINGYLFYRGENTGINVRGPAGLTNINFDELTEEQKATLKGDKGADGINGTNGRDGIDGTDGLSAYEVWLQDNGWLDHPEEHPLSEFYDMLANIREDLVKEGAGTGSLLVNYKGLRNTATGQGALAAGCDTKANGDYSFTAGQGTKTSTTHQIALGSYNKNEADNLFELGNGGELVPSNAFVVTKSGDAKASNEVYDGKGNKLSDKVTKEQGKGLSANDFNNTYKNFIDNYQIDTEINSQSTNPVTNSAIAAALESITVGAGKPTQVLYDDNSDLNFFHPVTATDGIMDSAYYTNSLTWNPIRTVLKTNAETALNQNVIALGRGLVASNSNQIIFGKYNESNLTHAFEIGNGTSTDNRSNLLFLTNNGDFEVLGNVTDGAGNTLSNKQDTLVLDTAPTPNSANFVNSGNIYQYLVSKGMNPTYGFVDYNEYTRLKQTVAAMQTQITNLQAEINELRNTHELIDDTYTENVYTYGIDADQFYIKLKDTETEEEEGGE